MKVLISQALSRLWNIRWGDLKEILGVESNMWGKLFIVWNYLEIFRISRNILEIF